MAASCNQDDEKYSLEYNIQRQMELLQLLVEKDEILPKIRNDTMPKSGITKQNTLSDTPEFEYHGYDCAFAKEYYQNVKRQHSAQTDKSNEKGVSAAGATGIGSADSSFGLAGAAGLAGTACTAGLAGAAYFNGATGLGGASDSDGAACFPGPAHSDGAAGFSGAAHSGSSAGFSGTTDSPDAFNDLEKDPEFIKLMEDIDRSNNNPVVRIFRLLESMHNYLKDEFPSTQPNYFPSHYVYDWPEKYTMPKTLSIRYQLQFAARKLNKFMIRLRRILKRNENLDYMKFKECNDSLTNLERLANELNSLKDVELRHENYEFKTDAMKAVASIVEMLIQRINDQIREAHLLITVFNWEMDLEHRQSQTMIKERHKTLEYAMEMIAKSRDDELKKQDPGYQAALKAKYKLPDRFNLDDLSERVAQYDDLWDKVIANPGMFYKNYNIPPEGLLPKSEAPKNKSVPASAPQFHNKQELNQMRFENAKPMSKEALIDLAIPLNNNTERPLKPTHQFG